MDIKQIGIRDRRQLGLKGYFSSLGSVGPRECKAFIAFARYFLQNSIETSFSLFSPFLDLLDSKEAIS